MLTAGSSLPGSVDEPAIIMQALSEVAASESAASQSAVAKKRSLLKRIANKFKPDKPVDVFSESSLSPSISATTSRASSIASALPTPTISISEVASFRASRNGSIDPTRMASPQGLETLHEEQTAPSHATSPPHLLIDYYDCALVKDGRLLQGALYICQAFLLFNAHRYGRLVARIQVDFDVLLACDRRCWQSAPNAIWLAMLAGNCLLANFRDRERAVECIVNAWAKRLGATAPSKGSHMQSLSARQEAAKSVPRRRASSVTEGVIFRRSSAASITMDPATFADERDSSSALPTRAPLSCNCRRHYDHVVLDLTLATTPLVLFRLLFDPTSFMANFRESHSIRMLSCSDWMPGITSHAASGNVPSRRLLQTFPHPSYGTYRIVSHQRLIQRTPECITVDVTSTPSNLADDFSVNNPKSDYQLRLRWCFSKNEAEFNRCRVLVSMEVTSERAMQSWTQSIEERVLGQYRSILGEDLAVLLTNKYPIDHKEQQRRLALLRGAYVLLWDRLCKASLRQTLRLILLATLVLLGLAAYLPKSAVQTRNRRIAGLRRTLVKQVSGLSADLRAIRLRIHSFHRPRPA